MGLPNFLIIGVPKAGTTSIYHYLKSHPEIYMPETTELRYFNSEEMLSNLSGPGAKSALTKICKNQEEYLSWFDTSADEMAVGECTTNYLYSKKAIKKIKKELGANVKLIVILRNPVQRAYSHFIYNKNRNLENLTFEEAILAEVERKEKGWDNGWAYTDLSRYSEHIKFLYSENINFKIYLFEDFQERPKEVISDILKYLEVDDKFTPENIDVIYNKGGLSRFKLAVQWLRKPNKFRTYIKSLLPIKSIELMRKKREQFISWQAKKPEMDKKTFKYLKKFFEEDVYSLKSIYPVDISKWGY